MGALEVRVFGSVLRGEVTGWSDLDLLVIARDPSFKVRALLKLEDELGELAYLVDLHVVSPEEVENPPYSWFLKESALIPNFTRAEDTGFVENPRGATEDRRNG